MKNILATVCLIGSLANIVLWFNGSVITHLLVSISSFIVFLWLVLDKEGKEKKSV